MMELLVNVKCNTLEGKLFFVAMLRLLITDSWKDFYGSSSRLIAEKCFRSESKKMLDAYCNSCSTYLYSYFLCYVCVSYIRVRVEMGHRRQLEILCRLWKYTATQYVSLRRSHTGFSTPLFLFVEMSDTHAGTIKYRKGQK